MVSRTRLAAIVGRLLDELLPNPTVPLHHTDAFSFLIAVLLSAQCTDERVNRVTPRLFEKAKTPEQMTALSVEQIQKIIRPCGLSLRKAKAIRQLSKELVQRFEGQVPATFHDLESLPGVGHKTASVVLFHMFHLSAFPVDRHVFRSAHRWHLSAKKTVRGVEEDLKKLFPESEWGKRALQIILYARQFCPSRNHDVHACPICTEIQKF